jgi:hypothetical protein
VNLPNAHAFITTQTPLKAAADLLEAIDALHQPFCVDYGAPTTCQTCDEYWPCSTARLLHPEKES